MEYASSDFQVERRSVAHILNKLWTQNAANLFSIITVTCCLKISNWSFANRVARTTWTRFEQFWLACLSNSQPTGSSYSDVIFGRFVSLLVPDKALKITDDNLKRSREIRPKAVRQGILTGFGAADVIA